jgi:hypothetical protein
MHGRRHLRRVAYVASQGHHAVGGTSADAKRGRGLADRGVGCPGDAHDVAVGDERLGNGEADTTCSTGYERHARRLWQVRDIFQGHDGVG